jgi:hypothetical protein
MRTPLRLVAALGTAALLITLGTTTVTADTQKKVATWEAAQKLTGSDGSLWKPTVTAGLPLKGRITVVDGTQDDGSRAMAVQARYAKGARSVTVLENYKGTFAALDAEPNIATALVGKPKISVGSPDMRYTVRATVTANCYNVKPGPDGSVPAPPDGFRCSQQDVAKFGGTLTVTMKPGSTMTAPGTTFVTIQVSPGVTYNQLISMVQGLVQIGP